MVDSADVIRSASCCRLLRGSYKSKTGRSYYGKSMVTVEATEKELETVVDPEIGLPITEMRMVDEISIQDDAEILIQYHLTAPFCPPSCADNMGMSIETITS